MTDIHSTSWTEDREIFASCQQFYVKTLATLIAVSLIYLFICVLLGCVLFSQRVTYTSKNNFSLFSRTKR